MVLGRFSPPRPEPEKEILDPQEYIWDIVMKDPRSLHDIVTQEDKEDFGYDLYREYCENYDYPNATMRFWNTIDDIWEFEEEEEENDIDENA